MAGLKLVEVPLAGVRRKEDLLDILATALNFPAYFGRNWDAAEECLRDLSWLPANGYVVWLTGSTVFWRDHVGLGGTLVEVALGVAESWADRQVAFHVVFQE
jgi:hypothetical protein